MAIEILMPALSPTMEEGTLSKWLVSEGDKVRSGDLLAEIETDKATMEFEAVDEGIIGKILISEGSENVKVNSTIAILLEDNEKLEQIVATPKAETTVIPSEKNVSKPNASQENAVSNKPEKRIFASPLARRIAKDKGLDLHSFSGSGPKGRIIKADLAAEPSLKSNKSAPVLTETLEPTDEAGIEVIYQNRDYKRLPIQGMRKVIAERLTEAKKNIPHFYLRRDIILDDLLNVRQKINKSLEARGIKVSINDFIIKACALALQSTPTANCVWAGHQILQMSSSDIAVAVAVDGGLFTPVLLDAESKLISQISIEMKDLAERARNHKLAPHEYQGGSFSISNLGMTGIDNFDAIINPPQAAILAVGAGKKRPIVLEDGTLGAATVMSVTMSVDHRVIDGVLGAKLLDQILQNLENPTAMLA